MTPAAAHEASSPGRVLVVEDEPELVDLTRMVLEIGGYEIESVLTGEEALRAIEESEPDVVLLDIRLPGISGWDVLEALAEQGRHIRVIPVSAHTSQSSFERALRMGCPAYVTKPFRTDHLLDVVERAMREPPPLVRPVDTSAHGEGEGEG